ncbi:MAG: dihydroorotate dehydrogenase electron transfer subunit [Oscillospiraceae bacterium]|jgi:dihydroorotate dehydrogenase electron transfer subunit|nr:dihydroorotate dehydrogenase electron transfer subunit [Oscillospiraceae bacterium]
MTQGIYRVEYNCLLTKDVWEMGLSGDTSAITAPGQFINIKLDGFFLRRPISVCDWDGEGITIIYRAAGKGTAALSDVEPGQDLDVLCGLGNGFDVSKCGQRTLVIGGGVGTPPMYGLAKALLKAGKTPSAILGFNRRDEIFYEDKFRALGIETTVATVDGSYGTKGFVTNALPERCDYFCACGPLPMLKAVCHAVGTSGLVSFEERMGCGFGACMGCSCKTKYGNKRICKDGPVLEKEEIIW